MSVTDNHSIFSTDTGFSALNSNQSQISIDNDSYGQKRKLLTTSIETDSMDLLPRELTKKKLKTSFSTHHRQILNNVLMNVNTVTKNKFNDDDDDNTDNISNTTINAQNSSNSSSSLLKFHTVTANKSHTIQNYIFEEDEHAVLVGDGGKSSNICLSFQDLLPVHVSSSPTTMTSVLFGIDELERKWLRENNFIEYDRKKHYKYGTVLYSHEFKKRYVRAEGSFKAIYAKTLESMSATGHTLCIDQELSYVRPFTIDVDCIRCRKAVSSQLNLPHCNETSIIEFCKIIKEKLQTFSKDDIIVSVWSRAESHNYHIRTNMVLSMPLHMYLASLLRSLDDNEFLSFAIEVPKWMPLPYSIKKIDGVILSSKVYEQHFANVRELEELIIFPNLSSPFYENCKLVEITCTSKQLQDYTPIIHLPSTRNNDELFFVVTTSISKQTEIPMISEPYLEFSVKNKNQLPEIMVDSIFSYFKNLTDIFMSICVENSAESISVNYNALRQDQKFMTFVARHYENLNCFFEKINFVIVSSIDKDFIYKEPNDECYGIGEQGRKITDDDDELRNVYNDDYEDDDDDERDDNKLYECDNVNEERDYDYEAGDSNKSYRNERNIRVIENVKIKNNTFECFVRLSAFKHGALNLQHFVVAVHKAIDCNNAEMKDFKYFLHTLYSNSVKESKGVPKSVYTFIKYYSCEIAKAYLCYSDDIIYYMANVHYSGLEVNMSATEVFNRTFLNKFSVNTIQDYIATLRDQKGAIKRDKFDECRARVLKVLTDLRLVVYYDEFLYVIDNTRWYYLNTCNVPFFVSWPSDISQKLMKNIISSKEVFHTKYLSHATPFLIPTECGVFNAITGLYVAHSTLLGFMKYRRSIIYPTLPIRSSTICYDDLNEDLLKFRDEYSLFFYDIICNKMHVLFAHYMFIPAIISLRYVYELDSSTILRFFNLALNHNLNEAKCIVELYPFNKNLVVYILMLLSLYGIESVCDYGKLCKLLFNKTNATTDEWLKQFEHLLKVRYTETLPGFSDDDDDRGGEESNKNFLDILLKYDDTVEDVRLSERDCVLGISLLVALFKNRAFSTFFEAFGYDLAPSNDRLPKPSKCNVIEDWKNVDNYKPSIKTYTRIYKRTMRCILRGRKKNEIEITLYNAILQLAFCVSFDNTKFRELLNMMSVTMITTNALKIMLILHGPMNTGKSFILDILTYALSPSVFAAQKNFEKHNERGGIMSKKLMIRCNELHCIDPLTLKAYTGEDPSSCSRFYNQNYEFNDSGQALFFVGTNYHIYFRDESSKKQPPTDPTLIKRLHAITFTSEHHRTCTVFDGKSSLFGMVANSKFFIGSTEINDVRRHFACMWLLFENYFHTRDSDTFYPTVDTNIEDSANYRQIVYCLNSELYRFLNKCDLCYEPGFKIRKSKFVEIVSCYFTDNNISSNVIGNSAFMPNNMTKRKFYIEFQSMYNINLEILNDDDFVLNFQYINLVKRVTADMKVEYAEGEIITDIDLENRIAVYTDLDERFEAKSYFLRNNTEFKYDYDYNKHVLINYRFVESDKNDLFCASDCVTTLKTATSKSNVFNVSPFVINP